MAKLYVKQNGSKVTAEIEMNGKVVLKENFKKSEAVSKITEYYTDYSIDYVERMVKTPCIGGAGTWTTYWYRDEVQIIEFFEDLEWIFRDKRKAVV